MEKKEEVKKLDTNAIIKALKSVSELLFKGLEIYAGKNKVNKQK